MAERPASPQQRRNPYAVVLRRLGQRVKPSAKLYSRKGRSKDRPFAVCDQCGERSSALGAAAAS